MQRFDFTGLGGFPVEQDVLAWMQEGYIGGINATCEALFGWLGQPVIMSGCNVTTTGTSQSISNGWVYHPSMGLMPFVGGSFPKQNPLVPSTVSFVFSDYTSPITFGNLSIQHVQIGRYAQLGVGGTPLATMQENRVIGSWHSFNILNSTIGVDGTLNYRRNLLNRCVEIYGEVQKTSILYCWSPQTVLTLPSGFLPAQDHYFSMPVQYQIFSANSTTATLAGVTANDIITTLIGKAEAATGNIEVVFQAPNGKTGTPLYRSYINTSFPLT